MRGFVDTSWGAGGSGGAGLIPSLDQFHTPSDGTPRPPGTFLPAPAERCLEFLDRTNTEYTVLYPTTGLAYGRIAHLRGSGQARLSPGGPRWQPRQPGLRYLHRLSAHACP